MKKFFLLICTLLAIQALVNAQYIVLKVDGMGGESVRFKDKTELIGFVMEGSSSQISSGAGGLAAGKRSYQPVTILKQTGIISPLLFQNFFTAKAVKEISIEYYRFDGKTGKDALEYTITLKNVIISSFKQFNGNTKNERFTFPAGNIAYDEIQFNFREIIMDYKKVNLVVQDNLAR